MVLKQRSARIVIANQWDRFGLPFLLAVLIAIFSSLSESFRTIYNLVSNLQFAAMIGIGAIGMAFCIMSGDFDISVGSMSALVGVLGASLVPQFGGAVGMGVTILLATGLGFLNGVFVTKLKIPAFITTLGMMYVYRAIAYIYTTNTPVYIKDPVWLFVGSGEILRVPFAILLMLLCFAVGIYLLRKTPFGRYVVAVGTNKTAARLSGINVDGVKLAAFTLVGIFVGISSVVTAANLGSVNPGMTGQNYEFQLITAVVLGGTALGGGNGNLLGAFFASLIITYLWNGLGMKQVNSYWQLVAFGLVLILAVGISRIKFTLLGMRES